MRQALGFQPAQRVAEGRTADTQGCREGGAAQTCRLGHHISGDRVAERRVDGVAKRQGAGVLRQ